MAIVYVAYNGKWDNNAYVNHELNFLMLSKETSYLTLKIHVENEKYLEEESLNI